MKDRPEVTGSSPFGDYECEENETNFELEKRENELTKDVPHILDKMNRSSIEVNMFTGQADEAERTYNQLMSEWSRIHEEMDQMHKNPMERIQPYFEAVEHRRLASCKVRGAAGAFAAASTQEAESKTNLKTLEQVFSTSKGGNGIALRQDHHEMIARATTAVQDAQRLRRRCEDDYVIAVRQYQQAQDVMNQRRAEAGDFARTLLCLERLQERRKHVDAASHRVDSLREHSSRAKDMYHFYMNELERISNAVHNVRKSSEHSIGAKTKSRDTIISQDLDGACQKNAEIAPEDHHPVNESPFD